MRKNLKYVSLIKSLKTLGINNFNIINNFNTNDGKLPQRIFKSWYIYCYSGSLPFQLLLVVQDSLLKAVKAAKVLF